MKSDGGLLERVNDCFHPSREGAPTGATVGQAGGQQNTEQQDSQAGVAAVALVGVQELVQHRKETTEAADAEVAGVDAFPSVSDTAMDGRGAQDDAEDDSRNIDSERARAGDKELEPPTRRPMPIARLLPPLDQPCLQTMISPNDQALRFAGMHRLGIDNQVGMGRLNRSNERVKEKKKRKARSCNCCECYGDSSGDATSSPGRWNASKCAVFNSDGSPKSHETSLEGIKPFFSPQNSSLFSFFFARFFDARHKYQEAALWSAISPIPNAESRFRHPVASVLRRFVIRQLPVVSIPSPLPRFGI